MERELGGLTNRAIQINEACHGTCYECHVEQTIEKITLIN